MNLIIQHRDIKHSIIEILLLLVDYIYTKKYIANLITQKGGMGMAKLFYFILSLVLVFAFVACTGEKVEEKTEMETEATVEKVMDENMAECPGCDMVMEKEKMIAHVHDGDTTYFCSEKCQEKYMAKEEAEESEGTEEEDDS